jgi:hypothetical protein
MSTATPTDVLRAKTDAELRFFVDNPGYYHADLVAAAGRELDRRGLSQASRPEAAQASTYAAAPPLAYEDEPVSRRQPLLIAAVVLGLAGAGGALYWANRPNAEALAAAAAPKPRAAHSLTLETVESHAMPSFDIDKLVESQVASIPASEKQEAQALRQFKALSRRFWAAETQSEFLTAQAHAGKASPVFAEQALMARGTWSAWNKGAVYGYRFGPTMQAQFKNMALVASSQQHILDRLPGLLPERKFLTDKEITAREAEVQDWMTGVRRLSPVTGKAYRATVLQFKS